MALKPANPPRELPIRLRDRSLKVEAMCRGGAGDDISEASPQRETNKFSGILRNF
jgi:hypothetical protein